MRKLAFWIDRDDFHAVIGGLAALTGWPLGHVELGRVDAALEESWYLPGPDDSGESGLPCTWATFALGDAIGSCLQFAADECHEVGPLITVDEALAPALAESMRPFVDYAAILDGRPSSS